MTLTHNFGCVSNNLSVKRIKGRQWQERHSILIGKIGDRNVPTLTIKGGFQRPYVLILNKQKKKTEIKSKKHPTD